MFEPKPAMLMAPYLPSPADFSLEIQRLRLQALRLDRPTPTLRDIGQRNFDILKSEPRRDHTLEAVGEDCVNYTSFCAVKSNEEELFNALITPCLTRIFQDHVLVNSEHFPWIPNDRGQALGKPDFFICPEGFYERRELDDGCSDKASALCQVRRQISERERIIFRFGVLADWRLKDAVYTLESKAGCLDAAAFGQALLHAHHMQQTPESVVRCMLFNPWEFWLIEAHKETVIHRYVGQWALPGAESHIRDFFPPLYDMRPLCQSLRLQIVDPTLFKSVTTAFLGCGAHGRVFRALPLEVDMRSARLHLTPFFAVKACSGIDRDILSSEYEILQHHTSSCRPVCDLLVSPIEARFESSNGLIGFSMTPVGRALTVAELCGNECLRNRVVNRLVELHRHGYAHGDPRPSNIMLVQDVLTWIDLLHPARNNLASMRMDVCILMKSILGTDTEVVDFVKQYTADESGAGAICAFLTSTL